MDVELTTDTLIAATPPTVTPVAPVNPVPVIITAVPPAVVPLVGEIEVTVGGGVTTFNCASAIYMKSPKSLDVKVKVS
jgi:hypothetical protein